MLDGLGCLGISPFRVKIVVVFKQWIEYYPVSLALVAIMAKIILAIVFVCIGNNHPLLKDERQFLEEKTDEKRPYSID